MSRSFKKVPIIKDSSQYAKRQANKKVRHSDISNFGNYKKLYEQWNISDWIYRLFKVKKIDSIPCKYDGRKMTYNEIMEYWRK